MRKHAQRDVRVERPYVQCVAVAAHHDASVQVRSQHLWYETRERTEHLFVRMAEAVAAAGAHDREARRDTRDQLRCARRARAVVGNLQHVGGERLCVSVEQRALTSLLHVACKQPRERAVFDPQHERVVVGSIAEVERRAGRKDP
jgi:hypothetical protein